MNLNKEDIETLKSLIEFKIEEYRIRLIDYLTCNKKERKEVNEMREELEKILIKLKVVGKND